ncbi:MAG TPA: transglycosylase SLT domain-containing protein [Steroidobacteraceae bacterium]
MLAVSQQLAANVAPTATSGQAAVVREFVVAMQRIRLRMPEAEDSPALQAFVIHDYLVAARLRRDLSTKAGDDLDSAIDTFLRARAGQPVTRALRAEWLASLADRKRWEWFLPRSIDVTDPLLICDRLTGRLATGDTVGLGNEVLARWRLPKKQPAECATVFTWLRSEGLLTAALAEGRTRAALVADNPRLAREFVTDVPAMQAPPLILWAQLLETPKATLSLLVTNVNWPAEPDALETGFNRLARSDSGAALALLPQLIARPDTTATLQARLQHDAALGAAYDHDPAAAAVFDRLPSAAIDGDVLEWAVRQALWAGDYTKVIAWIDKMPATLAAQSRWRYWRARAVAETSGNATAEPLFAEIAASRDYYSYLAADRIHRSYALHARPSPSDQRAQAALAAEPGLVRAHALLDCDMGDDAAAEWAAVVGAADSATKVQAAHLASEWGWYVQSIATLAQAGELDDVQLRYPRPYTEAIAAASKLAQLPSDWILAVMRQESLFRKDAVSRAHARGLMQMVPATATAVARRWHLQSPRDDSQFDPYIDVALGAAHLRELLDRYGNQLSLSLAAYNAGSAPLTRWLPNRTLDADIWIENIPYGETRDYVERIFEHIVAFAWVRGAAPPRLTALLPRVEPADSMLPPHQSFSSAALQTQVPK